MTRQNLTLRLILASTFVFVLSAALTGCVIELPDNVTDPGPDPDPDPPGEPSMFRSCTDGVPPTGLPTQDWEHSIATPIVVATGDPWHSAQDVIVAAGDSVRIPGKFSYGAISKDLEDEWIEVWIDDCAGGYERLGEELTDSDGRIGLPMVASNVPEVGEYGLYFRVKGDNSIARSTLRVYPIGTRFIVFDIDATLTTSDSSLVGQSVSEILGGNLLPEARDGALDIVNLRHGQHGYELLYLTGRPYLLDSLTRDWLIQLGFPAGTVHLTDDVSNSWPSEGQVGDYKADFLFSVIDAGFTIDMAYGNATSDIYAYERVDIPKDVTFILGEHGGESDTVALGEGYLEHIEAVRDDVAATQPFFR